MRAKIEKAKHVWMFEATGEFYAREVSNEKIKRGFFLCPSCEVKVYYKQDHFFSSEHKRNCIYVKEQFKKKA
ncbi:hypothetical protein OEA_28915 (plasmid) [Priestia megaterium NCT-2]|uniref:hypothetical protein n=1 Tax=Priestia megaterium TaxID=1404 RepID=UPI000EB64B12|nr:hypothetical protein [Priestia megaterium]AYE53685.1 hypothetical protein OEA_28915 [Priestia megaterium NCT-2]